MFVVFYITQVPNGIGFILGTIQLGLYMIYMNSKVSKNLVEGAEGGWQQRQGLLVSDELLVDEEAGGTSRD